MKVTMFEAISVVLASFCAVLFLVVLALIAELDKSSGPCSPGCTCVITKGKCDCKLPEVSCEVCK